MIKIGQEKISLKKGSFEIIKENFAENTCKTNLSPGLMFKQSYTGITDKAFVGNWRKYGFWISKFRMQLIDLRPDIIAKFYYQKGTSERILIRYSIGFSSFISWFFLGILFSMYMFIYGQEYYILAWTFWIILYIGLSIYSLKRMKKAIKEKIFYNVKLYEE